MQVLRCAQDDCADVNSRYKIWVPNSSQPSDSTRSYWMLLRRRAPGDRERARALLEEATALAAQYQLPRRQRLARELLATL